MRVTKDIYDGAILTNEGRRRIFIIDVLTGVGLPVRSGILSVRKMTVLYIR